ncbi:Amino acid transporter [Cinnamomum micranthum f. kanehirae]|uniref:Amino acid transporter n=1 Tax=Cinnamomum micranthum f. kanehirae TaxID=337451 RepID=A0A3S3Q2X5_9MAGN|nr:Amino acid transporter [Cinnamomum micranthum f. kanehirae]
MGTREEEEKSVPLLLEEEEEVSSERGRGRINRKASSAQTLGNIIVSIVGTGILGLPYAFRIAGWLAGSLGVILAGISTYYCMLLLVECKERLEREEGTRGEEVGIGTYGDLGEKSFGRRGRILTESIVLIAQCGGAVTYLVFIAQNLLSIFSTSTLTFSSFVFLLIPVEIALSWIRSLSALAPFSAMADVFIVLAMVIVVKDELPLLGKKRRMREAVTSVGGLPFAAGVAIFCFEGFSLTLPLQASMKERKRFPLLLSLAIMGITTVYLCIGLFGYLAYGEETRDIITLNLPNDWSSVAVKVGLCIGLSLTFPIMMHPVHEIVEARLKATTGGWLKRLCYDMEQGTERVGVYIFRGISVAALALVASFVPGFGLLISLVGSTLCALLSFVLPAAFHLIVMSPCLSTWQRSLDIFILVFGLLFACYGTYNAVSSASN